MPKPHLLLLVGALLLLVTGGLLVPQFFTGDETPPLRWSESDEVEIERPAAAEPTAGSEDVVDRVAFEAAAGDVTRGDEARVAVVLRGRVVDRFGTGQADAKVWLDFGRGGPRAGGRQRRVPDPVETDGEGRFAFQGQTFRSLRVSLQVLHPGHAPGLFDKDVGDVDGEVDLGDLVLDRGGELIGRVTDLEGNGIPGARVQLAPENGNRMRFLRDRDQLLADIATDNNGFFRRPNVGAGDWSVAAEAKMHTEGRSPVFAVENDQTVELDDIRLGPGYELTGLVATIDQRPVAGATVVLRGARDGNRGPGARDHRATTDEQGRFFLDHIPGAPMRLDVRADGYLPNSVDAIDPKLGQPVLVTLQEGLRITGTAVDEDGAAVSTFAVRAVRVRGLSVPGLETDPAQLFERLRNADLSDAEREALRMQMQQLRSEADGPRRGREDGRGRPGGDARELDRPEAHPDGRFVVLGLQEGIYELHLQSPDHARHVSAEVELRLGNPAPDLRVQLDGGVYVAGAVRDERNVPVANAHVSLRTPPPQRRGRGETAEGRQPDFAAIGRSFARQAAGAQWSVEVTTDAGGRFVLKHVPRGSYRLQATADGYADATIDPLDLTADRSGVMLQLGTLGAIVGQVRGLSEGEHTTAHVAAVPTMVGDGGPGAFRGRGQGGGPFRTGTIAADGSYRIEGLQAGDYVVRSWIGSPQELMRTLAPQMFAGTLAADVVVRSGEETRWDVAVHRAELGVVAGSVLHNGAPGTGLQIELVRGDVDPAAETQGPGGGSPGERGPGRGLWVNRSQQTLVAASGNFRIDEVPAGSYRLRVLTGRRGATLHEEPIQVLANMTTERNLSVQSVGIRGTLARADGGDPKELAGAVSLLPGLTELPADLAAWRRDNTSFDARIRNGEFRFDAVQPGNYLLMVQVGGQERTSQQIVVGQSGTTPLTIAVRAAGGSPPANVPTPRQGQPR